MLTEGQVNKHNIPKDNPDLSMPSLMGDKHKDVIAC